jgi:hypothetical protein
MLAIQQGGTQVVKDVHKFIKFLKSGNCYLVTIILLSVMRQEENSGQNLGR